MCAWINKPKKKQKNEGTRKERQKIYNTPLWKGMRLKQVQEKPICQVCELMGKVTLAEDCHHLRSFLKGKDIIERQQLAFDTDNIISVCKKHHSDIHTGFLRGCESLEEIKQRLEAQKRENQSL